jgi:predicted small lipoprotein YifL
MKKNKLLRQIAAMLNISILLSISACGLKGDLYIPEIEAAATSPAADVSEDREAESETQAD